MCNDSMTARPRRALTFALLPALLCALLLAGCGGGGSNAGGSGSPSPAPPVAPLSVSAVTPSGLTATLAQSAAAIAVGGSVTYTLTLKNNTNQPITFSPVNSLAAPTSTMATAVGGGLDVTSPSGSIVYPPPNTGTIPGGGTVGPPTTLAPGQSVAGTVATGNVFGAPGSYSATAFFTSQNSSTTTVGPLTVTVQ